MVMKTNYMVCRLRFCRPNQSKNRWCKIPRFLQETCGRRIAETTTSDKLKHCELELTLRAFGAED